MQQALPIQSLFIFDKQMRHDTSSMILPITEQRVSAPPLREKALEFLGVSFFPLRFVTLSIFLNPPQSIPESTLTVLNMFSKPHVCNPLRESFQKPGQIHPHSAENALIVEKYPVGPNKGVGEVARPYGLMRLFFSWVVT